MGLLLLEERCLCRGLLSLELLLPCEFGLLAEVLYLLEG